MGGMMRLINEIEERGEKKGIEKGMEKGIEKGKIETAIKMLKEGVDIAFISRITDLPVEKINDLQKELNIEDD